MFDYKSITHRDYYFIVDENGNAWTDTANKERARSIAEKLAKQNEMMFNVYDHTGIIYAQMGT